MGRSQSKPVAQTRCKKAGPTRLAFVGNEGGGKSALINALKRANDIDSSSASAREKECPHADNPNILLCELPNIGSPSVPDQKIFCQKVDVEKANGIDSSSAPAWEKGCPHADNPNILLCELPNIGSSSVPDLKMFCQEVDFKKYDAFIFVTDTKLGDKDKQLTEKLLIKIKSFNKPFYFVRAKMDEHYKNRQEQHPNVNTFMDKIRKVCSKFLNDLLFDEEDIFVVSALHPHQWDFPRFNEEIKSLREEIVKVHVAMVGRTGSGKSTFIKALRGLKAKENGAAGIGENKEEVTTKVSAKYSYPPNPHITLCDLPGIGSSFLPDLETYCEKIKMEKYDAFVFVHNTNFEKIDEKLLEKLKSQNKPLFFVRTKIDVDYHNKKMEQINPPPDKQTFLQDIRKKCYNTLKTMFFDEDDIFVINNYRPDQWDFPRLNDEIKIVKEVVFEVHVALVGQIGSGRSSFVNVLRGFKADDEDAAKTGVTQTTKKPECYPHLTHPHVKLWDLRGLDTYRHPDAAAYCEELRLQEYDAFILFIPAVLEKTDFDLVKEVHKMQKPLFVVRTNVDGDLSGELEIGGVEEEEALEEIKDNILLNVEAVCGRERVFFISNIFPERWDFKALETAILDELQPPPSLARKSEGKRIAQSASEKRHLIDKASGSFHKNFEKETISRIERLGVKGAQEEMVASLDKGKDDKENVTVAFVGRHGSGKSSLINALRGIKDGDKAGGAAEIGIIETTMERTDYHYPGNSKIQLCDLPGLGSRPFPDIKSFDRKWNIRQFDSFILVTANRFNENDYELAKKLRSMNKPFFFVRTKIDQDRTSESKKEPFKEHEMLERIKKDCSVNLKDLKVDDNEIFLISNHHRYQWDFPRLLKAILDRLPINKQASFSLSIRLLSEDILNVNVKTLRDGIPKLAGQSRNIFFGKNSRSRDLEIIEKAVTDYLEKLGLPDPGSASDSKAFQRLSPELQEEVRQLYLLKKIKPDSESSTEEHIPLPALLDEEEAMEEPLKFVDRSLHRILDKMAKVSLAILKDATETFVQSCQKTEFNEQN